MEKWIRCVSMPIGVRMGLVLLITAAAWLLMSAFGLAGPEDGAGNLESTAGPVTVYLAPVTRSVQSGESFTLAVRVASGDQPVGLVGAFVDFDPQYLQTVDIAGGTVLTDELYNALDNTQGQADYVARAVSGTVTGTFTLNTITFQAIAGTDGTTLTFHALPTRETRVISGQTILSRTLVGGQVAISETCEAVSILDLRSDSPAMAGESVNVTATLTGTTPITYRWDFGDGTLPVTGTGRVTASHVYTAGGSFTVTLTVTNPCGSDVATHLVTVVEEHTVYLPLILRDYTPLRAKFIADPISGRVPLTVTFTNESTGYYTDSLWEFGDGVTSTQTNPTHAYELTGTFTVTLTVVDASGTSVLPSDVSTLTRPNYITVYDERSPQAPSQLQATPISWSQFRLAWQDNASDEDGFTIYEGANWVADVGVNTTVYTASGFGPGTYHCFRVYAYNEHGNSDWSNWGCGTTPACEDLILNGGFETDGNWDIPTTPYPATYTTAITHTGARAMRSGIVEADDNQYSYSDFRQTVTIPTDAVSATLRFWLYRISGETPYTPTFPSALLARDIEKMVLADDLQYVLVLNEDDQIRRQLIWQRADDQAWTRHEFDMLVHAGETIKLQFGVYNDGSDGVTAMYVDDVSLEICLPEGETVTMRPDDMREEAMK